MKIIDQFLQEEKDFGKRDSVKAIVSDGTGKILIIRRTQGSCGAGNWDFPGGHIEKNENKNDALKREIFEETNLKVDDVKSEGKITLKIPEKGIDSEISLYSCKKIDGEVKLKPADWSIEGKPEHNEYRWIEFIDDMEKLPMLDELKEKILKKLKKRDITAPELEVKKDMETLTKVL